jgi:hypothetical protein
MVTKDSQFGFMMLNGIAMMKKKTPITRLLERSRELGCVSRRVSRRVSLCVSRRVSRCVSSCVSRRVSRCVSRCVSRRVSIWSRLFG